MTTFKIDQQQQTYGGEAVNERSFRDLMGMFATGVTVITTTLDGKDYGTTANAVSSVSTSPPMLLTCLNKSSNTGGAIARATGFMVNILAEEQEDLARSFASKGVEKFDRVDIGRTETGQVFLADSLAYIECRILESVSAATHNVIIGEVVKMGKNTAEDPLLFYRGKFGGFHLSG